ncbi:ChrR family anti-sigma-E factor [Litoreibacter roseus]|uniref:Anti-sigma-E factor ChrR n=1 Tax=Litoreibacter roseus TaxID=2601869 RepID=A0A6N6JLN7_9RHOB|nr:ChrR family anti-sigma-E factor [Litoreibacter roseus]GFE66319.1 anti-sigma-E factor ChrR [Litoreibacter roseus]
MDNINHHLTDQLLLSYAAGTLPEAFSLVLATHISMCDECRARLGAFETVGGAMLEASVDNATEVDLASTLKLIAGGPKDPILVKPLAQKRESRVFPQALTNYVGGDLASVKWRSVGMGVRQSILKTSGEATVRLLHIPAGCAVPDHGHRGLELTLVLQGAFRDETDRFARGDIEVANEDMEHTPVAEEGMDCICLAATDAPLRFNGIVPRIAQPFLRI